MRKIIIFFAALLIVASCKKKKDPEPEPTPTPTPVQPVKNQVSVKINDAEFTCTLCVNTYFSGGSYGVNFSEPGMINRFVMNFSAYPAFGTYTFTKSGFAHFRYEKNGYFYDGAGTIHITEVDSSSKGGINKLVGTFSCKTDTLGNISYSFTEGVINLNFK